MNIFDYKCSDLRLLVWRVSRLAVLVLVVALETSLKVFAQVVASSSVHEINAERRREGGVGRHTFNAWTGG